MSQNLIYDRTKGTLTVQNIRQGVITRQVVIPISANLEIVPLNANDPVATFRNRTFALRWPDSSNQVNSTGVRAYADTAIVYEDNSLVPTPDSTPYDFSNSNADAGDEFFAILQNIIATVMGPSSSTASSGGSSSGVNNRADFSIDGKDFEPNATAGPTVGVHTVLDRTLRSPAFSTTVTQKMHKLIRISDKYVVGSTMRARINWSAPGGAGSVLFNIRVAAGPKASDVWNTPYGDDTSVTDNIVIADDIQQTRASQDIAIGGLLTPGGYMLVEIEVDHANTTDSLSAIRIMSVDFQFLESADTIAQWPNSDDFQSPTTPVLTVGNPQDNSLDLSWTGSTDNVAVVSYQVQRSTSASGPFSTVHLLSSSELSVTDSGLSSQTQFFYRVRAIDAVGNASNWSTVQNNTTTGVAFAAIMSGITHTQHAWWSMLRQRYNGFNQLFEIDRNSDNDRLIVEADANGYPNRTAIESFLGTALVDGDNPATIVRVITQTAQHTDLDFDEWTVGSITVTRPILHYDSTRQILSAKLIGTGSGNNPMVGRAGHDPEIIIPNGVIWFDSFQNNDNSTVARLRDHYILNTAEAHELVLHNGVPYYTHGGGPLMSSGVNTVNSPEQFTSVLNGTSSLLRVRGIQEDPSSGTKNSGTGVQGSINVGASSILTSQQPVNTLFYEMGCVAVGITQQEIVDIETQILDDLGF